MKEPASACDRSWPWPELPARPSERLLFAEVDAWSGDRMICTSLGRAQLAYHAALKGSKPTVDCWYLDLYAAQLAWQLIAPGLPTLTLHCATDLPSGPADFVALPFSATGDGELVRELLQQGYERLRLGGTLAVATDNPGDHWLGEQLERFDLPVVRSASETGICYALTKTRELRKHKTYHAEIVFRVGQRLLRGHSRPGVFSHRQVDPGARRLLERIDDVVGPGSRVLDMGCGWGPLSLAAATAAEGVQVVAADSCARAVEAVKIGAQLSGCADQIEARLTATGEVGDPGSFDLVLANPPYYADFRIARLFVDTARTALRSGGKLLVVTKLPDWYRTELPALFADVTAEAVKGYHVFTAVQQ